MNYVVAIPSANRLKIIQDKTLSMLEYYGIDMARVFVFAPATDYDEYNNELKDRYNDINVVVGGYGIQSQRMAISNFWDEDQLILSLDDDIKSIHILDLSTQSHLKILDNLDDFIITTSKMMKNENINLCGLYPINNSYFMRPTFSTDLKFIIGQFKLFYNKKICENREFQLLEDFETTLKYYLHDRKVLRFNNICLTASYKPLKWNKTQSDKNNEVNRFKDAYIEFCNIANKKNNNMDIRFIKRPPIKTLSTLWLGNYNELVDLAIDSWIKIGYNVNLYTLNDIPKKWEKYVFKCDPKDVMELDYAINILPFSDLWRYKLLLKYPSSIWIDADMVLLKRLPNDNRIISSEHTFQSGAFKSISHKKPNIGILYNLPVIFLTDLINKIDMCKAEFCDNMKIFQNLLKTKRYQYLNDYVLEPDVLCPVPWWNCDNIYYDNGYKEKYNVKPPTNNQILNGAIGVHMWNNFTYNKNKINFDRVNPNGLYYKLRSLF